MELAKANAIAEELQRYLSWGCERIVIAGSIRRQKPEVKDIELLCVPAFGGIVGEVNKLDEAIVDMLMSGHLSYRLNKRGQRTYGDKNKFMVHKPSGIGVDIFCTDKENWGMALFIRTGPKELNIKAMKRFMELGMKGHAYGGVSIGEAMMECPDEETVFKLLGWKYLLPEQRNGTT